MIENSIPVPESLVDGLMNFLNMRFERDRLLNYQIHYMRELQRAKDAVLASGGSDLKPKMTECSDSSDVRPGDETLLSVGVSLNKLRLIAAAIRRAEFTSVQAEAFLALYGTDLNDRLEKTIRDFLAEKL